MQNKVIFRTVESGESICDLPERIGEAFDGDINPLARNIPIDEHGIQQGCFTVVVTWTPPDTDTNSDTGCGNCATCSCKSH